MMATVSRIAAHLTALSVLAVGAHAQCQPVQVADLTPNGGAVGDIFGYAVAASGDLVLAGASRDAAGGQQAGAAYLYARDQGGAGAWGEVAQLRASDASPFSVLGTAVAVSSDTAVAGASCESEFGSCAGAAYVFERDAGGPGAWGQAQKLTASDAKGGAFFGNSAATEGDLVLIGATNWSGGSGAVYVFERSGGLWTETGLLTASDAAPSSNFGGSIALDGDVMVVTAENDDGAGSNSGAAYVFRRDPMTGAWTEEQKLLPAAVSSNSHFGSSCGIFGDTIAVGRSQSPGSIFVFERDTQTGAWAETATLIPASLQPSDWFGTGLALEGDVIVGGAPGRDKPDHSGAAFVFERSPTAPQGWLETHELRAKKPAQEDGLGRSVALAGRTVVVGAPSNVLQVLDTGEAFVFDDVTPPLPVNFCIAGTSTGGCVPAVDSMGFARRSQPDGFQIRAQGMDGSRPSILFWGTIQQGKPWGATSWLCIRAPFVRTPLQITTGGVGSCKGTFTLDFNAWMMANPNRAPAVGTTCYAQIWYRDPGGQATTSALTQGLSFGICP